MKRKRRKETNNNRHVISHIQPKRRKNNNFTYTIFCSSTDKPMAAARGQFPWCNSTKGGVREGGRGCGKIAGSRIIEKKEKNIEVDKHHLKVERWGRGREIKKRYSIKKKKEKKNI